MRKKNKAVENKQSAGIRIVIVDDNELFCSGIQSLLTEEKSFSIVGAARQLYQAMDLIRETRPHIILLNLELNQGDGLSMISELLSCCQTSRLAVLTDSRDPHRHKEIISRGAIGIISKQESPGMFKEAIKRVHSGSVWLDRHVSAEILGNMSGRKHNGVFDYKIGALTRREREVIQYAGKGLKNKEIANSLGISDITVHHHLTSIYSKLEVENRLELIIFAYRHNLAEVPH